MIMQITVEDLLEEDKEVVRQLLVKSYEQYENDYKDPTVWQSYLNDIYHAVDNPNVDKILVARHDTKIVGCMQLFRSADQAYNGWGLQILSPIIRFLAVDPAARGLGIAQELVKNGIQYASERQATSIYLHSSDAMKKAIQLYEWMGFKRDQNQEFVKGDILVKCYRYDL